MNKIEKFNKTTISCQDAISGSYNRNLKFDLNKIQNPGIRFLYYYEPELIVSHVKTGTVNIINLLTGEIRSFQNHAVTCRHIEVFINPQSQKKEIAIASWDGSVSISNYESLKLRAKLTDKGMGRTPHFSIDPGRNTLVAFCYDSDINMDQPYNVLRVFSLESGALLRKITVPHPHLGIRRCGTTVVGNNAVYCVSNNGYFQVFDSDFRVKSEIFINDILHSLIRLNDDLFLVGSSFGNIFLYSMHSQKLLTVVRAHFDDVMNFYADQNDLFYSLSFDGTVKKWGVKSNQIIQMAEINISEINNKGINELWTITKVGNKLLVGGEERPIYILENDESDKLKYRGTLAVTMDRQFALLTPEGKYYASDPSLINVVKKENETRLSEVESKYLAVKHNDVRVLSGVFFPEKENENKYGLNQTKFLFQIPQHSRIKE
jgi:WD40 repeat protein